MDQPNPLSRILLGTGMSAAMALLTWSSAALADGRISVAEVNELMEAELAPRVRRVVVEKGERLRIARKKRQESGQEVGAHWMDSINHAADLLRFRQWATSAFADGKLDEGDISDLVLQHILPAVLRAATGEDEGEGADNGPGPLPDAIRRGPLRALAEQADAENAAARAAAEADNSQAGQGE